MTLAKEIAPYGDKFFKGPYYTRLWTYYVAKYLNSRGLPAGVPELNFSEDIRVPIETIECWGKIIAIRPCSVGFSSAGSFPFDPIFVDSVDGWGAREVKPYAYINVSRLTGCMIWTPGVENVEWEIVSVFDRSREVDDSFYACKRKNWRKISDFMVGLRRTVGKSLTGIAEFGESK